MRIHFATAECSLGSILVGWSPHGICAILLGDAPGILLRDLRKKFPSTDLIGADAEFQQAVAKVIGFIETPSRELDLQLDICGTPFQQRVWQALREIPAGKTVSYTEVAQRVGSPKAVRAVARACAANKLAVAIPCHRVVRHDGNLAGYYWGVERKRQLLEREAGHEQWSEGEAKGGN